MTATYPTKQPKIWKSYHEQLEILLKRGLLVDDKEKALHCLKTIGYYRLSGYLYSFRQYNPHDNHNRLDNFIDGSYFDDIWQLYQFDRSLRLLAIDALERIEISVRNTMAYILGEYDSLAHYKPEYFHSDKENEHKSWIEKYQSYLQRSNKIDFVKHHNDYYKGELPIWAAVEIWDFGLMSRLYKIMQENDKDKIAKIYHFPSGRQLQTCLHALNIIRNIAAHHSRLWNRAMVFKASVKGMDKKFQQLDVKKVFIYFCLIKHLLDSICPKSDWDTQFLQLLEQFPKVENNAINLEQMGIQSNLNLKQWQLWQ